MVRCLVHGHPHFRSIIVVDVTRVKSYVDCDLDPMSVPVRVSINKPCTKLIVVGLMRVFRG